MRPEDLPKDAAGDALRRVLRDGSDLSQPMDIDFHVDVPDEAAGKKVAEVAGRLGYKTNVVYYEEGKSWTCWCTIRMVADYDALAQRERELDDVSRPYGGHCAGWGTFGNVEEA